MIENDKNITYAKSLIFDCILPGIYIAGAVTILIFMSISYIVFCRKIGKQYVSDRRIIEILDLCKVELNIRKKIEIVEQKEVRIPALFGFFRPRVLVYNDIYKMSDDKIKYVFMHELAHYTKLDLLKNAIFSILQTVYWFNPIIHICFKNIRKDMEITTDNIAISHLNPSEHKEYCKVLIEVATSSNGRLCDKKTLLANRVLGISNDKKSLEGRISMIKNNENFSKKRWVIGIVGAILVVLLGVIFCTSKLSTTPPELYVTVDNQRYTKFIRGGYEWNTMFQSSIADALMPKDFEYTETNTIKVEVGDSLRLTNVENKYNLGGNKFYTSDVRYYKENGEDVVFNAPIPMGSKEATIELPKEPGTYILSVDIDYYNSGRASYGLKVIVGYDMDKFKQYANTYIGDAPKVSSIINMLPYAQYLNGIELHTATEPYGVTVNYSNISISEENLDFNSIVLFSLIQNLDNIEYNINVEENEYTINSSRSKYEDIVTLNYTGLIEYVENIERTKMLQELKKVYLPLFSYMYSYLDGENVDKDSVLIESSIAMYFVANPDAIADGRYSRQMINDVYYEMTGNREYIGTENIGVYEYVENGDYFYVATELNTPLITKIDSIQKLNEKYIIEYEYCYPSDSVIFNLPMIEVGENTYTIDKEAYEKYIENLPKYTMKVELSKNSEYKYSKWMCHSVQKPHESMI